MLTDDTSVTCASVLLKVILLQLKNKLLQIKKQCNKQNPVSGLTSVEYKIKHVNFVYIPDSCLSFPLLLILSAFLLNLHPLSIFACDGGTRTS